MSKFDGRHQLGKHTLIFNVNTFCDLEEALGAADVNEVAAKLSELGEKPSLRTIRKIVCVALRQDTPDMTEQKAGEIVSAIGLQESVEGIMAAVTQAFPDQEEGEGEKGEGKP